MTAIINMLAIGVVMAMPAVIALIADVKREAGWSIVLIGSFTGAFVWANLFVKKARESPRKSE